MRVIESIPKHRGQTKYDQIDQRHRRESNEDEEVKELLLANQGFDEALAEGLVDFCTTFGHTATRECKRLHAHLS